MLSVKSRQIQRGERGQAIILFVGIFSVILVIAAIVVDFGLWFAERRSAQRGADLAAAAAAQDLPDEPLLAFDAACDWAEANGYATGVEVEVFARGVPETPVSCPGGTPALACGSQCDAVRVTVSNDAPQLFTAMPFFGIDAFDVGAVAVAGLTYGGSGGIGGTGPDQTVLLVDAQGRMRTGFRGENCGRVPQACPIGNERSAAAGLVDRLLGLAGDGEVGYAPYHNCYGPASPVGPTIGCVPDQSPDDIVIEPTTNSAALHAAIEATGAYQREPANICTGLSKANEMFLAEPSAGHRAIILMSDGDNLDYPSFSEAGDPPGECRPLPSRDFGPNPACSASRQAESELDYLTLQMATRLKNQGVEIYVIALNPCAWAAEPTLPLVDNPWPTDCDPPAPAHDNDADQRLLMCIATSPEHYQRVNNVAELPDAIEEIASDIVSRSLLQ